MAPAGNRCRHSHVFIIFSRRAKDGLEAPFDSESESDDGGIEGALSSTACAEADKMGRVVLKTIYVIFITCFFTGLFQIMQGAGGLRAVPDG